MTDTEDRLAGYRPSGPPPDLRARILRLAEEPRPVTLRAWLPALAAAALAILFYALGVTTRADITSQLRMSDELRPVEQWLPQENRGTP